MATATGAASGYGMSRGADVADGVQNAKEVVHVVKEAVQLAKEVVEAVEAVKRCKSGVA